MFDKNAQEEEIKLKVAKEFFGAFDCTQIHSKIDFCVAPAVLDQNIIASPPLFATPFLWAEAKRGVKSDLAPLFVQLILTIGRHRLYAALDTMPPLFLGAFDSQKIAFLPFDAVAPFFAMSDFDWTVAPSDTTTKEFSWLSKIAQNAIAQNLVFDFAKDRALLCKFIKSNFATTSGGTVKKSRVNKNNFIATFQRWHEIVAPTINVDWEEERADGILEADFFLADLLCNEQNFSIYENLKIVLEHTKYRIKEDFKRHRTVYSDTVFKDAQRTHAAFWRHYDRPPAQELWDYMIRRYDLLVPQDIRERKGDFYTPRRWVELSQDYLAAALGEDYQDDFVIWDCAAGTGNLLAGLTNPRNIFASTLYGQHIDIINERIKNGANLLASNIFQFDFLNDPFLPQKEGGKLPDVLFDTISVATKRRKLLIYINPPYAEATNSKTVTGSGANKIGVATQNRMNEKYKPQISSAANELFALFFARIYDELNGCKMGAFSKLKYLNSTNFKKFRELFKAEFKNGFICPANTFDNVKGQFPIGFLIWDTTPSPLNKVFELDAYEGGGGAKGTKRFFNIDGEKLESLNKWLVKFKNDNKPIALLVSCPSDFQHNQQLSILTKEQKRYCNKITPQNLIPVAIYFAVRHAIEASWLNDRDQFLAPNDGWQSDDEFQNDCLIFTLFHGQNRITSKEGTNHLIPFIENEINCKHRLKSDFLVRFINGKITPDTSSSESGEKSLFVGDQANFIPTGPLIFSSQAEAVFAAARRLFSYYHEQSAQMSDFIGSARYTPNASLYDIKEFFQGRDEKGKMIVPQKCKDEKYKELLADLNLNLKSLAAKIAPKIYKYGFLRR